MERKKMLTMNWDALDDDDDDDRFFESRERMSTAVPRDLGSSSDEDDGFEDSRMSFQSVMSAYKSQKFRNLSIKTTAPQDAFSVSPDYDIWMAEPESITARRKRLFQGMGLDENTEPPKNASFDLNGGTPRKADHDHSHVSNGNSASTSSPDNHQQHETKNSPLPPLLVRSRSDGDIEALQFSCNKNRKEEMIGADSKQRLTRTLSDISLPRSRASAYQDCRMSTRENHGGAEHSAGIKEKTLSPLPKPRGFFLIKNLDTGKEFVVKEYNEKGTWNHALSDMQTGKQLTIEEFEKCVSHSPVVKELMRRAKAANMVEGAGTLERKLSVANNYFSKSLRLSKRRGVAMLKSIKGVAQSMSTRAEKERELPPMPISPEKKPGKDSSGWVKVRQSGKTYKDLSALHMCQEFQAHQGSIWTIKFSCDARFLASGGEDKIIHIWEVQECEIMSLKPEEGNVTPLHSSLVATPDRSSMEQPPLSLDKKKKGKIGSKRSYGIPEYVHVPETVFSFADKPFCSLKGHSEDVLDLSWSRSQQLLSSSMDKTVRLWDVESRTCLKSFAHKDYVTCVQFNPVDDDYFVSGSLDAKVRLWSVPERLVVDWTDMHEMVTAISFTPDGQGVIIGSHKGTCRMFSIEDCKLSQKNSFEVSKKKNTASHSKKITGFQFSPNNPSTLLVSSADSRIRVLDGGEVVHKYKGCRNTSNQIAASFTADGKYVLSASEDSQVYIWRHEDPRNAKRNYLNVTRAHENFLCKDVSVAISWHGAIKGDPPSVQQLHSKRHSKRSTPLQTSSALEPSALEPSAQEENPSNSRNQLPPLPKKNMNSSDNAPISPDRSRRYRHNSNHSDSIPPDEDFAQVTRSDSCFGHSFNLAGSSSIRFGESPSISSSSTSPSSSWPSFYAVSNSNQVCQTAWGLVIVTASLGGEIRCYQNFGIPRRRLSRH